MTSRWEAVASSTASNKQLLWISPCTYVTSPAQDACDLKTVYSVRRLTCVSIVTYHLSLKNDACVGPCVSFADVFKHQVRANQKGPRFFPSSRLLIGVTWLENDVFWTTCLSHREGSSVLGQLQLFRLLGGLKLTFQVCLSVQSSRVKGLGMLEFFRLLG
jgi:hypothetical protein